MTAPTEHLRSLLTTHVGTSGWQLETGSMPQSPIKVIMLSDTPGTAPNPKYLLDFPSSQIMIRGEIGEYLETYAEAEAVYDILLGITSLDIGGDRMVAINMLGGVGFIGRDENDHPLFAMNLALIIEPAASAETNRIAL